MAAAALMVAMVGCEPGASTPPNIVEPTAPGSVATATQTAAGTPNPSVPRTPQPETREQIEWTPSGSDLDEEVTVVAPSALGWIALGVGAAWFSADGLTWSRGAVGPVTVDPPSNPGSAWEAPVFVGVAELQGTLYALARWHGTADSLAPLIFSSSDGMTWTHLPSDAWWGYSPTGIASDGSRLIVTNHDFAAGAGSVLESPDGISWAEHRIGDYGAGMTTVYADADGVVAVGYRLADDSMETPVVWLSSAPSSWEEVPLADAPLRTTPQVISRTASGDYLLLTATIAARTTPCSVDDPCEPDGIGAWTSANGRGWTASTLLGQSDSTGVPSHWQLTTGSRVAVAMAATPAGIAAWSSRDGSTWAVVGLPTGAAAGEAALLAARGDQLVLIARSGTRFQPWLGDIR
jgi:hypothetical protein